MLQMAPSFGAALAVFAIQHVANHLAPLGIHLVQAAPLRRVHLARAGCALILRIAAFRATIRKSRLIRFQFKLLTANNTYFNWKRHNTLYFTKKAAQIRR